ncbi:MAG: DEAD/DEAH box helicase, partial [Longimicrobiaceae bacterium]
ESDAKPWLRRKLMVELVRYDLAHGRPRVTLASDHGFAKLEAQGVLRFDRQCVLDRAEADFNTRRVVDTLRRIAQGHGEARFVRGVLDGAVAPEWLLAPLDADAGWRATVAAAPRPVLNPEQVDAWRAAFQRAVTVIWGPPGTGKTYLLAWTLLGLAAAAKSAGRPLRILVSAATHRAIANVLVRIARELAASGIESPLRLVKLASRGTEADQELEGAGVELVRDERLEGVLAESDATGLPVVVGSTVWSLWKRMKAAGEEEGDASDIPIAPMFDVVVIDEASQMKVADSLIALSSIRRGGRVLLCGDDRQLAPVVRGSYDGDDTLFGSAFGHFAGKFGRMTLRESRRMNAPLVAYPRRTFYPGLLSVDPGRRLDVAPPVDGTDAMDVLVRDAFLRPEDSVVLCTYAGYTATARNPFEARLAAQIATLARDGLRDPATGQPYTPDAFREQALAILSPHRAQNSAILHELTAHGWTYAELPVVDTVERMQGNEREMIIVSYAVSDREYAEREAEFLLDPNRFNVAITRPRSKLVLLMSDEILRALPRDERVMTESMAVKGYAGQPWREVREIDLPAPDGTAVHATVRVR